MTIRPATADDAPRITDIDNQGIAERGATFETEPRPVDGIRARIEESERFPLLVADDGGDVIGWAGLSSYRARACYAGIAELSIYLDRSARGHGIERQLLERLIPENLTPPSQLAGIQRSASKAIDQRHECQ